MSRSRLRDALIALSVTALFAAPAVFGQSSTYARLIGTVTDQGGGVMPGVTVTALNKGTNIARTAVTDERGDYLIDKLIPGMYDLSVEQPGFRKQVATLIAVQTTQVVLG